MNLSMLPQEKNKAMKWISPPVGFSLNSVLDGFKEKHGEFDASKTFMYLFRRFGQSSPSDHYKYIAEYLLTTEEENIKMEILLSNNNVSVYFSMREYDLDKTILDQYKKDSAKYYQLLYEHVVATDSVPRNFETNVMKFVKDVQAIIPKHINEQGKSMTQSYIDDSLSLVKALSKVVDFKTYVTEYPNYIVLLRRIYPVACQIITKQFEGAEKTFFGDRGVVKPMLPDQKAFSDGLVFQEKCVLMLDEMLRYVGCRDMNFNIFGEIAPSYPTDEEHKAHVVQYSIPSKLYIGRSYKDSNEKMFVGDIVRYGNDMDYIYVIQYIEEDCQFRAVGITSTQSENNLGYKICDSLVKIGTINDNPELIQEAKSK